MTKPFILVLGGGESPEREISFWSSTEVSDALKKAGYKVARYDPSGPGWKDKLEKLAKDFDMVFPILHGVAGEDGQVQAILEKSGTPYLGSNQKVSELCFDKMATRHALEDLGVLVAEGGMFDKSSAQGFIEKHPRFVAKPCRGGSSIDVVVARNGIAPVKTELERLFQIYDSLLIEELIDGDELTVAVVGDKALPPILILPPYGGEFDFENKYNGRTVEVCPIPESQISTNNVESAAALAEKIHTKLGARHLSRVDMILSPEGKFYVLEINTMPGMTSGSLMPAAAKAAGYSMPALVKRFVELVENAT